MHRWSDQNTSPPHNEVALSLIRIIMSAAVAAVAGAPVGRPEYATESNDTAGVLRLAKSYLSTTRHEVALRIRMHPAANSGGRFLPAAIVPQNNGGPKLLVRTGVSPLLILID